MSKMAVKSLIHVIIKFVFFLTPKLFENKTINVPPAPFPFNLISKSIIIVQKKREATRMTPFWAKTFFGGGGGIGKEIKFCMLQVDLSSCVH